MGEAGLERRPVTLEAMRSPRRSRTPETFRHSQLHHHHHLHHHTTTTATTRRLMEQANAKTGLERRVKGTR